MEHVTLRLDPQKHSEIKQRRKRLANLERQLLQAKIKLAAEKAALNER